jgi:hypothetical protein
MPYRAATMTPRRAATAALAALFMLAPPARAAYHALEEIPVESPVYGMVEALATSYGAGASFLHTLPWDRADLGRFLDGIVARVPAAANDPLVIRLARELAPTKSRGGWEPAWSDEDDWSSVELSPYGRANYSEDRARGEIVRDFRAGLQGSVALGEHLLGWADVYAGTTSPGGHGNPTNSRTFGLIEGVQLNSYFDRGTLTWRDRHARIEVGHTWLRWGPGAWGTMALSDGAPAFDVVEARVPLLKRAQLEWFLATLDPAVQSYLAGHRLELRPSASVDLAFSELARFDGTASAPLYLLPMVPYSHWEKRILKSSDLPSDSLDRFGKNNVMWAIDGAWRVRTGLRAYGELAIDDISFSSEQRPRALAWQLGFDARRAGVRAWSLRGEYSHVYRFTYSTYHHHDFEFAGLPTGFPLGPDVDRLNGRLECRTGPEWALGLEGTFTRKGDSWLGDYYVPGSGHVNNLYLHGVIDADKRIAGTADYAPAPGLAVGVTAGWARVDALRHVAGDDRRGGFLATRLTLRW